jgi:uncharacterized membrane protein (UPF0127 family)
LDVLVVDGRPVAPIEVASSYAARSKGLLGRSGIEGALLIRPGSSVHTFGMRFGIDVAFCDRDLVVQATVTMARHRVGRPRLRTRSILEAEAGAFDRWQLVPGSRLTIAPPTPPDRGAEAAP